MEWYTGKALHDLAHEIISVCRKIQRLRRLRTVEWRKASCAARPSRAANLLRAKNAEYYSNARVGLRADPRGLPAVQLFSTFREQLWSFCTRS